MAIEGSHEEVLKFDVDALLAELALADNGSIAQATEPKPLPERFTEVDVKIMELSSTGDGLGIIEGEDSETRQIYTVPFTVPGDVVRAKVIVHHQKDRHSMTDYIKVLTPSPLRDDSRVFCKYFSSCSGCQFQMLDYSEQLKHKRSIVEKAFKNFSSLPEHLVPQVLDTMGSPLDRGYRTKLTPHFDAPPGARSRSNRRSGIKPTWEKVPEIGFMLKGRRITLDIEDCPIGTDAVRAGMKRERKRVVEQLDKYSKGATILLRESTERVPTSEVPAQLPEDVIAVPVPGTDKTDLKSCISNSMAESREYIDKYEFLNPAGSFFQNNNSILSPFTQYIRDNIIPPSAPGAKPVKYLIDAYSGSGLFTVTLSGMFEQSMGIDVATQSIEYASKNAAINGIPPTSASFLAADAAELFKKVTYPADETVVVIDPSRKGCDDNFLRQLLAFGPRRVVYVSCNVHTQARDVGVLVHGYLNGRDEKAGRGRRYRIESLRGFDFFPQTGHVEGVAVLDRVDGEASEVVPAVAEVSEEVKENLSNDVADAESLIGTGAVDAPMAGAEENQNKAQ
jgi:tRNA (uracil-5-)-methyltransferase